MPSAIQQLPKAWLIGSGIEPLVAAFYLIDKADLSGAQIRVLDTNSQIKAADASGNCNLVGDRLFSENSPSLCQDRCLHDLLSKMKGHSWKDYHKLSRYLESQDVLIQHDPAYPTQILIKAHSRSENQSQNSFGSYLKPGDRKMIIVFMLQQESNFSGETIENVFDDSFFGSDIWELFSSK
jgi:myosin-crossreactive antigen